MKSEHRVNGRRSRRPFDEVSGAVTSEHKTPALRLLTHERPKESGHPSQDALLIVRFPGSANGKIPNVPFTRVVVIDGVTPAHYWDEKMVSPVIHTASGHIDAARLATRIARKWLRLNLPAQEAVQRAHEEIQQKYGHIRRGERTDEQRIAAGVNYVEGPVDDFAALTEAYEIGTWITPRELPQAVVGVLEIYEQQDGKLHAFASRWGDAELWIERSEASWISAFDKSIWTSWSDDEVKQWLAANPRKEGDAEWRQRYRVADRNARLPKSAWVCNSIGRYDDNPNAQHFELDADWTRLVFCTDGPRFSERTIRDWEKSIKNPTSSFEGEVKKKDDWAVVVVERNEMPQDISASFAL